METAAALAEYGDLGSLLALATPEEASRLSSLASRVAPGSLVAPSGGAGTPALLAMGMSSGPSRPNSRFSPALSTPFVQTSSNSSSNHSADSAGGFRPPAEILFGIGRSLADQTHGSSPSLQMDLISAVGGGVAPGPRVSDAGSDQATGSSRDLPEASGGGANRDQQLSGESSNVVNQLQDRRKRYVDVDGREYAVHNTGADLFRHAEFSLFFRRMADPVWLSSIMLGEGLELNPERVLQALTIRSRWTIMRSGVHGATPPTATSPAPSRSSRLGAFDSIRLLPIFCNEELFAAFLTGRWGLTQGRFNLSHFSEGGRVNRRAGADFSHSDIANAIQNFNLAQISCFGAHWEGITSTLEGHLRFESTWRSQRPQFVLWRIEAELEDFHFVASAKYDRSDLGESCPESLGSHTDLVQLFTNFLTNISPDATSENYFRRSFDFAEKGTFLSLHGGPLKGGRESGSTEPTQGPPSRAHSSSSRAVKFADDASATSGSSKGSGGSRGPPSPPRKTGKKKPDTEPRGKKGTGLGLCMVSLGHSLNVKGLEACTRKECPYRHVDPSRPLPADLVTRASAYLAGKGEGKVPGLDDTQRASLQRKLQRRSRSGSS